MKRTIVKTADGSSSVFLEGMDVHYHSIHGAVQESQHVFIDMGLKPTMARTNDVRIFEMGFGTGLNAFMSFLAADNCRIHYTTVEAFPLEQALFSKLDFLDALSLKADHQQLFLKMHQASWNMDFALSEAFTMRKIDQKLEELTLPDNNFDIIYYDAFAPTAQAELWTVEVFAKLFRSLAPNGILTTYCAKGAVRRAMQEVGFTVERLAGPPRKREMLRAVKQSR